MPKQITKITEEHKARFPEWREKWIKIGLDTKPADFPKAAAAIARAYDIIGVPQPKIVITAASPVAMHVIGSILERFDLEKVKTNIFHESKFTEFTENTMVGVNDQIRKDAAAAVAAALIEVFGNDVEAVAAITTGTKPKAAKTVEKFVEEVAKGTTIEAKGERSGQFWAGWCSYISFFRDVMDWENPSLERFTVDEDLTLSCGWVRWHTQHAIICNRPTAIHLDERSRQHCENNKSIAYRDGWGLYYWHGVAVPEKLITKPDSVTAKDIKDEKNAEVRRVMIERFGYDRYMKALNGKKVGSDATGTLWQTSDITLVEVVNGTAEPDGTFKHYWLSVPPTTRTAKEGVAWTYGMTTEQYDQIQGRS